MNTKLGLKIVSVGLLCTLSMYTVPVFAYTKDETVYSKLDSTGKNYKTIVSTHLENDDELEEIKDFTDLFNIENTNGDEEFLKEGDSLIWKANKKDIYYQGETEKELPVKCEIKYELNGKEISAEEIAGKSGHVKMTLHYTNNEEKIVNINGKEEKIYVPFVVVCGTVLKGDKNKNVEISTGKVIKESSRIITFGLATPGLKESLNIDNEEVDIPDDIEISMDTESFEIGNLVSYVTPKILEKDDFKFFDKLYEIFEQVNTLKLASTRILNGANTLSEGAKIYSEKSQEFNNAMNQVSKGVSTVNENYSQINNGINSLSEGSNNLSSGAEKLNAGINTLNIQVSSLPSSVNELYSGTSQVVVGLNGDGTQSNPGLVEGVNGVIDSLNSTTQGLSDALQGSVTGSENAIRILEANNNTLNQVIASLSATEEIKATNSQLIEGLRRQIDANNTAIEGYKVAADTAAKTKSGVESRAKEGASSVATLKSGMLNVKGAMNTINSGLGQLSGASQTLTGALAQIAEGSKNLNEGSKSLKFGTNKLAIGSSKLNDGIQTLDGSTKKLTDANGQLTEGAENLAKGSKELSNGIKTFNEQGINKICNYVEGKGKNVTDRIQKLRELSEEYNNFTILNDGDYGNVKFIMIIDAIKKQEDNENNKEEAVINTNIFNNETNNEKESTN